MNKTTRRFLLVTILLCGAGSVLLAAGDCALAQVVTFTEIPRNLQLFARDAEDSACVVFSGVVWVSGSSTVHDSVRLEVYREGELFDVDAAELIYNQPPGAAFDLSCEIHAELSEYAAFFYVDESLVAARYDLVCGDVYLINGQSNAAAEDFDHLANDVSEWLRTFGSASVNPNVCAADTSWDRAQGHTFYTHAAVGVWGLYLGFSLVEESGVPIAILNGGVGGTPITEHLRNDAYPTDLSTIYGRFLWRVREAGIEDDVRAFLWHQGESDTGPDWDLYPGRFDTLWNAWHEDYEPVEKVYLFQVRPGCGLGYQPQLREVQRTLPELYPDIEIMSTVGLVGHDGCHYHYDGYVQMAEWVFPLLARDFYGSSDTLHITPPNVQAAYYYGPFHNKIRVRFDSEVLWPADTLGHSLRDYFYLDDVWGLVESGEVAPGGRTLILTLTSPSSATRLTYLPNRNYHGTSTAYNGPWIRNPRGIGALSFHYFTIEDDETGDVAEGPGRGGLEVLGGAPNPFPGTTGIRFALREPRRVRVEVFDVSGRLIRTLADRWFSPGHQTVTWDGRDGAGNPAASGAYFYRLEDPSGARYGKLLLLR